MLFRHQSHTAAENFSPTKDQTWAPSHNTNLNNLSWHQLQNYFSYTDSIINIALIFIYHWTAKSFLAGTLKFITQIETSQSHSGPVWLYLQLLKFFVYSIYACFKWSVNLFSVRYFQQIVLTLYTVHFLEWKENLCSFVKNITVIVPASRSRG